MRSYVFNSLIFLFFICLFTNQVTAGVYYDDWVTKDVPEETKHTTLYYGKARCEFRLIMPPPNNQLKSEFIHIAKKDATSKAWVSKKVYAPLITQHKAEERHPYTCKAIEKLPHSYVKEEVIKYKTVHEPIQPFPSSVVYKPGACKNKVRKETIVTSLGHTSANNMKVYASAQGKKSYMNLQMHRTLIDPEFASSKNFPNTLIYDGVPTSFVGYEVNTSKEEQSVRFRVKLDDGSSFYAHDFAAQCK
ncbi:hypothetical protein [uncultured Shewanella sp.]|uniref:hypothetical protein n=1 Tax=uncultured Shewanella sp. TaxID=173975 RepID=UPI00262A0D3B|nr:hypothetical protein [uncultured Shewanella sp.]